MHTLVYLSAASFLFSNEEMVGILNISRSNNTRRNITGLLLYHEGSILQILEGDKETIHTLYNRIGKDARHTGIIKTLDAPIQERNFPDWSMGFKEISNNNWSELSGYFDLGNKEKLHQVAGFESAHIIGMIKSFAYVNQL